jgi:hypothetical protein
MNYLFIFDKGSISLFPLLEFEKYVWEQHELPVIWESDNQFPNNHIIGYVDESLDDVSEYYYLLCNKTEELMSSEVCNTCQH